MAKPKHVRRPAQDAHINWMLYGDPGVGKSVLAGTSPNALILASSIDETVSMNGSTADIWVVTDHNELAEATEYVMHEGHRDYEWVWIDNGTLFQDLAMDDIMKTLVAEKTHRQIFAPDKAEYGQNQNRYGLAIRTLVQSPINFGMTAHVMMKMDEHEEERLMPAFQGGQGLFSQKVCGWMNLVTYMEVRRHKGKLVRVLTCQQTDEVLAKDRFQKLGNRMIVTDVSQVMDKIGTKGAKPKARKKQAPTK